MKFLIYGGNGWIGKQIINILEQDKENEIILSKERVNNVNLIENELINIKPDRVISLIGRTSGGKFKTIDFLEHNDKLDINIQDNLFSIISLAFLTKKYNIHLTSMGTGCIFNYDNEHKINTNNGFMENDIPNFKGSNYSIVKGYTDQLLHNFDNVLNVRIRMPITNIDCEKNFISKIIRYKKICSIPNSMTVLPELLPYLVKLIYNSITGTINLTNPGYISHNEILDMYKDIIDNNFTYENFSIDEQNKILLGKRSNNFLNTDKLLFYFPNILDIKTSIRNVLLNWKKK